MTRYGKAMGALVVLMLVGCGATSEEVQTGDAVEEAATVGEEPAAAVAGPERFGATLSSELPATEEAFRRMMSEPLLLSESSEDAVTKVLLERQIEQSKALSTAYSDVLTREESVASGHVKELAIFRQGQMFLRFGCSVARSAIPTRFAEDQRARYQTLLAEQAQVIFTNANDLFDAMPERGHEEFASHVTVIRKARPQSAAEVSTYCRTTEPYWLHPAPRTVEATLSQECENGDGAMCWVWGTIAQGGEEAVARACAMGYQPACSDLDSTSPTSPAPN